LKEKAKRKKRLKANTLLEENDRHFSLENSESEHKKIFEKMCVRLKGECNEDFSQSLEWTQMCVLLDKRELSRNTGLI